MNPEKRFNDIFLLSIFVLYYSTSIMLFKLGTVVHCTGVLYFLSPVDTVILGTVSTQ